MAFITEHVIKYMRFNSHQQDLGGVVHEQVITVLHVEIILLIKLTFMHYNDVIMGAISSEITSLASVYSAV